LKSQLERTGPKAKQRWKSQLEESFVEPTQYGPPPDPSLLGAARMGLMLRPQAYAAAAAAAEGGTPFQPGALSGGAFMTPQSAGGPSASSFDPTWQSWPQGQSCAENCAFVGHGGAGFGLGTGADSPASRSYERRGSEVRLPFLSVIYSTCTNNKRGSFGWNRVTQAVLLMFDSIRKLILWLRRGHAAVPKRELLPLRPSILRLRWRISTMALRTPGDAVQRHFPGLERARS